jgi:hypothetical protein
MPQVVVAAASYLAAAAGTTALAIGAGTAVASAVYFTAFYGTQLAIYYGISRTINRRPSLPSIRAQGTEVNVRDPAAPRQIIYGQRRVSGVLYPVGTSGTNNEYLHLLILIAGHECEELGDITFGDEVVPLDGSGNATGRFAGYATIKKHLGTYNQTVDTALQTALGSGYWTNNHKLGGIAYLYVRLKVSADLFPGGIPEIYCLVKGRKVYDHRDGTHDATDASTWDWSANATLCLVDWLRGVPTRNSAGTIVRNHGVGALDAEIDTAASDAAANICDENVVLDDASTEDRYTANGVLLTSVRSGDGIELLKSAMAGDCVYVGGKWIVLAGAYRSPTLSAFGDGDLRAPLSGVRLKPATGDLYNVGRGLYVSADNNWQPTDLPQVSNATYLTQDGGDELPLDLEFPFTTSAATGQRLLKIAIERSRQGIAFVAKCKLHAWQVRPGDVIQWTDAELGWSGKAFEVLGVALVSENDANGQPYLGADLTLRETAAAVWDWSNGEETAVDAAPNTSLRSPYDIAAPSSLSVSNSVTQQPDGTTIPRLLVGWTAPADANVTTRGFIRIEYKLAASSDYLPMDIIRGDIVAAYILAVVIGQSYNVRIRSENDLGNVSAWVTSGSTAVTGDTTAPSAPSGLAGVVGTGKAISLDWNDNTEDDFMEYKVFRNTSNSSGTATEIAEVRASRFVDTQVTLGTDYYYWIKAVDTSENVSGFSSGVGALNPSAVGASSVDTTAPGTPSAPTFVSETTYLSGDGTVFSRITIALSSLPSGAVGQDVLYRRNGATDWIVGNQLYASGNASIDDLSPVGSYEFAVRAFSFSGAVSADSSTLSRTAPNSTTAPGVPTSTSLTNAAGTNAQPAYVSGVMAYACVVGFTTPANADLAYIELKATNTNSDGATDYAWWEAGGLQDIIRIPVPNSNATPFKVPIYSQSLTAGYVRVRSVSRTGVASAWVSVGNANGNAGYPAGNMSEQNKTAIAVTGGTATGITNLETTGITTGGGSSPTKVLVRYVGNVSVTLAGGAPSESFNVSLSNRGFSTKPDSGHLTCVDPLYVIAYDSAHGSSTSTNAVCTIRSTDGSNIPATTTPVSVIFEEKD